MRPSNLPEIVKHAYEGQVEKVRELITEGISVNTVDPRDNLTLLHIDALHGDERLSDVILERATTHGDVDFTIRSSYRPRLAWQFAANSNNFKIAEKILAAQSAQERKNSSVTILKFPQP